MESKEIQKIKDQLLKELISTKAKILEYTDLSTNQLHLKMQ